MLRPCGFTLFLLLAFSLSAHGQEEPAESSAESPAVETPSDAEPAEAGGEGPVENPPIDPPSVEPTGEQEPPPGAVDSTGDPIEFPRPQIDTSPEPLGTPPWLRPRTPQTSFLDRQLQRPAEMLELFNIDESQLDRFFNERPIDVDEYEPLYKLLFRMPQFTRMQVRAWLPRTEGVAWEQVLAEPSSYRAEFFPLRGTAVRVVKRELAGRVRELFEFGHYYEVELALDEGHSAIVFSREVPEAWLRAGGKISEPAGAEALFLKTGDPEATPKLLYFVAERLGWYPATAGSLKSVTDTEVYLAGLGMDVSLFDQVRGHNRRGVSAAERECFYSLMAATARAEQPEIEARAEHPSDLAPMLVSPEKQHGKLVNVHGNARRITKVPVSDPDIQARFGIDHYYQIDVFVPLGDQAIRLVDPDGSPGPSFENTFPVTCCVLRLPEGMTAEALEDEDLRVRGFYFKLWSYRTEFARQFDRDQLSPMVIGIVPEVVPPNPGIGAQLGLAFGALFVLAILGAWYGIWRYNREDREFKRSTLAKQFEVQPGKSLDDAGIEASDGPDFSNLP